MLGGVFCVHACDYPQQCNVECDTVDSCWFWTGWWYRIYVITAASGMQAAGAMWCSHLHTLLKAWDEGPIRDPFIMR